MECKEICRLCKRNTVTQLKKKGTRVLLENGQEE